jgi:hypothetical protein
MPLPTFRLRLPADPRYRALAAEAAARYLVIVGGSDAEAASLEGTLADAMAGCAGSSHAIDLRFLGSRTEIEIELACGGRSSVIRHPLAVG